VTATNHSNRRVFLAGAGAAIATAASAQASDSGPRPVRRIVTTQQATRGGVEIYRQADLPVVRLNGSTITRLWETPGVPVRLPMTADAGISAGNAYREGFTGTSLYVAEIPPRGVEGANVAMHRENSLDYIAVLEGEIYLTLESGEIHLQRGDVLVQGGNSHGWENRADTACRLLVVVLSAAGPAAA
jgi:mannose-6-phosphate isomerase-like protein (cupin superfamily)